MQTDMYRSDNTVEMITEKTPTLYLKKISSDCDKANEKFCTRTTLSWFFAVILVTLVVVLTIQFFYPTFNLRFSANDDCIRLADGKAIDVRILPPGDPGTTADKELGAWDLNFLLDPVDLCITRNPPNSHQYEQEPEVKLLMLVPSAVDHFEHRRAIRKTWGSVAEKPLGPMRLGFVLGTTDDKAVTNRVREESARHGDIVQADFVDSHHHQTTKSVLMLKWVARRCPHAHYFLKAEDDTFVNVGVVADILGSEPFVSQKKFIGGNILAGAHQTPRVKPSLFDYDSHLLDEYPAYASGSAYVMPGPVAVELFDASREVEPFLPLEDAFLTGLCADYIDAPRIHDARFAFEDLPPTWDALSSVASAPSVPPDTLEAVWNDLTQSSLSLVSLLFNQEAAINSTVVVRLKRNL